MKISHHYVVCLATQTLIRRNIYLTLPTDAIRQLGLTFAGYRRAMLGDGRVVVFDVYLATLWWFGQAREILVFQAEGGALLGMALLSGSRMTLDAVENGVVTIEQLGNSAPV